MDDVNYDSRIANLMPWEFKHHFPPHGDEPLDIYSSMIFPSYTGIFGIDMMYPPF